LLTLTLSLTQPRIRSLPYSERQDRQALRKGGSSHSKHKGAQPLLLPTTLVGGLPTPQPQPQEAAQAGGSDPVEWWVRCQEEAGLDFLIAGSFDKTDMVEVRTSHPPTRPATGSKMRACHGRHACGTAEACALCAAVRVPTQAMASKLEGMVTTQHGWVREGGVTATPRHAATLASQRPPHAHARPLCCVVSCRSRPPNVPPCMDGVCCCDCGPMIPCAVCM
jgi:hypothetical protein